MYVAMGAHEVVLLTAATLVALPQLAELEPHPVVVVADADDDALVVALAELETELDEPQAQPFQPVAVPVAVEVELAGAVLLPLELLLLLLLLPPRLARSSSRKRRTNSDTRVLSAAIAICQKPERTGLVSRTAHSRSPPSNDSHPSSPRKTKNHSVRSAISTSSHPPRALRARDDLQNSEKEFHTLSAPPVFQSPERSGTATA